ncbi:MAG: hypothetical protein LBI69_03900 [Puniceicoccales bacterium]|jgi:tetratricopeptide (TPR) repeat protein|nr:hypothetical protein [Puniceicoccales bacterium]
MSISAVSSISDTIPPTTHSTPDDNEIAKNFHSMLCGSNATEAIKFFLKLYENNTDDALNFLCNKEIHCFDIAGLLADHLISDDVAAKIFEKLYEKNQEITIEIFSAMFNTHAKPIRNKAVTFFSKLYKNNTDDAINFLCNEKISIKEIGQLLANHLIIDDAAAEILRKLYVKNLEKTIEVINNMYESSAAAIFLKLYESDDDQETALAIVSNNVVHYSITVKVLTHADVCVAKAVKIFKILYTNNKAMAILSLEDMLNFWNHPYKTLERAIAIFLELHTSNDDKEKVLAILSSDSPSHSIAVKILANTLVNVNNTVEIFKILYEKNPEKAINAFCDMPNGKAAEVFFELYNSNEDNAKALAILSSNKLSHFTMEEILLHILSDVNRAVEIFKKLYEGNSEATTSAFVLMITTNQFFNEKIAILLKLYENDNDKDNALKILCHENISVSIIKKLLTNSSVNENMAAEIFKGLLAKKPEKAVEALEEMTRHGEMRALEIFLQMAKNCEDAAKILLSEKINSIIVGLFLATVAISPESMARILTAALSSNAATEMVKKSRIAHILDAMCSFGGRQEKVVAALRQMDQDAVDSLFRVAPLRRYGRKIRAEMGRTNTETNMQCHEEEFIANFQSAITGTEIDKVEDPSDGEILRGQNRSDGEDSLINLEMPTAKHPGWLEKIFTGTVGKVLAAVAAAAGSGLALWAVILWPLATCIGAGCAVVALAAVAFFRDRSANERKALEANSDTFAGDDLLEIADI